VSVMRVGDAVTHVGFRERLELQDSTTGGFLGIVSWRPGVSGPFGPMRVDRTAFASW